MSSANSHIIASPISPPRPKKRQRIDIACNTCKARKVKCDGIRPVCGPCSTRRSGPDSCVYRQDSGVPVPDPGLGLGSLNTHTHTHTPIRPSASSIVDLGNSAPASASWTYQTDGGAQSSPRASFGRRDLTPPSSVRPTDNERGEDATGGNEENKDLLPSENLVGASIDASFLRQIKNAMNGSRTANPRDKSASSKCNKVLPRLPPTTGRNDEEDMRFVLPTRKTADHLMQLYWDYVATIFPWLERPVIEAAYGRLWSNDEDRTTATAPVNKQAFHCILNLIFATACSNGPSSGRSELQCLQSAEMFFRRAEELMSFNMLEMNHFEMVQILLLSAVHLQAADKSERFCNSVNMAISIALNLGLHLPGMIEGLASPGDRDLGRSVWHGCIIMDKLAAMTFGCTLKVPQDVAKQVKYPRTLDSQDPTQPARPDQPPADLDFYVSFCRLHHILGDVLEAFYTTGNAVFGAFAKVRANSVFTPEVLADLFQIESDLCDWQASLNSHLRPAPNYEELTDTACSMRQANILHARYLCVRLLLFRPFFFPDRNLSNNNSTPQVSSRVPLDEQVMGSVINDCRYKCIHAARDIIELIFNNPSNRFRASGVSTLPSHWYIISYVYMAATVLIAAKMFPKVSDRVPLTQLGGPLQQAYRVLQDCEPYTDVARKCRVALTFLHETMISCRGQNNTNPSTNANANDDRHDQYHRDATFTAGATIPASTHIPWNIMQSSTGTANNAPLQEVGASGLEKEDLDELSGWPLYWNEWPSAFFPGGGDSGGNGNGFVG